MSQKTSSIRPARRWSAASVVSAIAVLGLVLLARAGQWLEPLERNGYDLLMQVRGELPVDDRVVLVGIDDATLKWLNRQPPIPRRVAAQLVDRVAAGGAQLIVLDQLLSERQDAEDDAALVDAMRRAGNVVLPFSLETAGTSRIAPLDEFAQAALATGYANLAVDSDVFCRRATLFEKHQGARVVADFSLSCTVAAISLGQPLTFDAASQQFRLGAAALRGATRERPEIYINYRGYPPRFRTVSARDVLTRTTGLDSVAGKIVIIGQNFTLAPDLFQTPFFGSIPLLGAKGGSERLMSGMEVHGNAIATLLDNSAVVPLAARAQLPLDLVFVALALIVLLTLSPARSIATIVAITIAILGGSVWAFDHARIWNRFVVQEIGVLAMAGTTLSIRYAEERRARALIAAERQRLMGLFERYVSAEVASEIWDHREELMLQGREIPATILFSDIRGFTAMSEGRSSADILSLLNDYFEVMNSVVKRHRGFLNKYIGDGLMVLYGVPLAEEPRVSAHHAVSSALEMLEHVRARQADRRWGFSIGVGVHSGVVSAGNIGARDRMEYSVIGEAVNLASRLESLNKDYHTHLIISERTYALVSDAFVTRELGKAAVRGLKEAIPIYEVLSERETGELG